ncbi:MAG: acylphosphatase [Candidatus Syntrophosphaera sp.]|nr:acylphosphatase [Candidatus Syntrophosphaera sp.]
MLSWEIIVHGRVQGVGFRSFSRACARRCGITGYARNLYDGTVEIIACGSKENLELFRDMLNGGNGYIRVRRLDVSEVESTVEYNDFGIR